MSNKAAIGLIGLGVMGLNLARNIADKKYKITVFNRTTSVTEEAMKLYGSENFVGALALPEFVNSLETPRKVILMVQAGEAVDAVIAQILPLLEKGDIIIDCGNSNYQDTRRRSKELSEKDLEFVGCGVSGGEEGALKGPSIMPGGSTKAWEQLAPIFKAIAAKDFNGNACTTLVGRDGAGHYVKMVHNGIEYAVMQNMAEAYDLLRSLYSLSSIEIAGIFEKFNQGSLNSYLFEIAVEVLKKKDELTNGQLIDHILDTAEQKGTGKWTAIDAFEQGVGTPSITSSVIARVISSDKATRVRLSEIYGVADPEAGLSLEDFVAALESALYASMLISYAQGYDLIQKASVTYEWDIDLGEISRIWEGGCIIRAKILHVLHTVYSKDENKKLHIFEIADFTNNFKKCIEDLRVVISVAVANAASVQTLSNSLQYFDAITKAKSSANFIQGLRDYFGAHTYQRTDRDGYFHTEWSTQLNEKPSE